MKIKSYKQGELPPQLDRAISDHTGLIRELQLVPPNRAQPEIFISQPLESALSSLIKGGEEVSLDAAGKSLTREDCLCGAVGEFLERYCLYWPPRSGFKQGTYSELDGRKDQIPPYEYLDILPAKAVSEFDRVKFRRDTSVEWCTGSNLIDGCSVLMPAQRIYMGADRGGEFPHCFEATSNGCAAARTEETAIKRSINELVERDAFVRTWYSAGSPPKISLDNFPEVEELKRSRLESEYISFELIKMRSNLPVFAVGCVAYDKRERTPKFVIGTAAAPHKEEALIEALIEAAQGWPYVEYLAMNSSHDINPEKVDNFEDNVRYYAQYQNFEEVEHLLEGNVISPSPGSGEDGYSLQDWLTMLSDHGVTPIAFNLTTRDIRDLGVEVTRVCTPELLSLPLPSLPHTNHPNFPQGHTKMHPLP